MNIIINETAAVETLRYNVYANACEFGKRARSP